MNVAYCDLFRLLGSKAKLTFPRAGDVRAVKRRRNRTAKQIKQDSTPRKSEYASLCWDRSRSKWIVEIQYDEHRGRKRFPIEQEEQVARHHDAQARRLLGSKAELSFPLAGEVRAVPFEPNE